MFEISKADINNMMLWVTTLVILLSFIIALFTFVIRKTIEKNVLEKNNKRLDIKDEDDEDEKLYCIIDEDEHNIDLIHDSFKKYKQKETKSNIKEFLSDLELEKEVFPFESNQETLSYLRKQIKSDTIFKTVSFYVAIVMAITGTIILIVGAINVNETKSNISWITTFSGALMDIMSTVFFWLVNRTMREVRKNSEQLERIENLFNAMLITKHISNDSTKDEIYKDMVYKLMNIKMISR